jgi:hypothetical protein
MTNSVTIPSAGAADTITVARDLRNAFLADFTGNNIYARAASHAWRSRRHSHSSAPGLADSVYRGT